MKLLGENQRKNKEKNKNQNKDKKIIKFKKSGSKGLLNIGVFIFLFIFIYIVAVSVEYFTTHNISTYEVGYGSIIKDTEYTGLILRSEEVYYTSDSGYTQFYYLEGSKVSYGNYIYTLSQDSTNLALSENASDVDYTLSTTDVNNILNTIQTFNSNYNSMDYSDSYTLLDDINSIIQNSVLDEQMSELDEILSSNSTVDLYETSDVGIISYNVDGYEGITIDNFTSEAFDTTQYNVSRVSSGDYITDNMPIYKLILDEVWYILIELDVDDITTFEEITSVELKFLTDNESTSANISLLDKGDTTYGLITMSNSMIRYSSERFTNIEIILDELDGYKIPITSVVSREFYEVPLSYITKGGDSSSNGVLISSNDGTVTFQETDIYYQTSDYAYIGTDSSLQYAKIIMEETSEEMRLMDTVALDGVYVVNKGYAEFYCVDILTESMEYYIVDDAMSYSISNYDRIALYGDSVEENAIIN